MKSLFLLLISLLVSGLLCAYSHAQSAPSGSSITGSVRDSTSRKSLDFITINLMEGNKALKADFTKADGSFSFQKLKRSQYSVVIVGLGYKTKTIAVDLSDSTKNVVDLGVINISATVIG